MTMKRLGSTQKYAEGWDRAFGKKRSAKTSSTAAKTATTAAKTPSRAGKTAARISKKAKTAKNAKR